MDALRRNPDTDHPLIVFLELIGNDVCNSHSDVSSMTSTTEFKANILTILGKLNATLPKGSHVWIFGLAPGVDLYKFMGNRMHPLGITYE